MAVHGLRLAHHRTYSKRHWPSYSAKREASLPYRRQPLNCTTSDSYNVDHHYRATVGRLQLHPSSWQKQWLKRPLPSLVRRRVSQQALRSVQQHPTPKQRKWKLVAQLSYHPRSYNKQPWLSYQHVHTCGHLKGIFLDMNTRTDSYREVLQSRARLDLQQ